MATRKTPTKKSKRTSINRMKKREETNLLKTIDKYETNLSNLVINSHKEGSLFLSNLLLISLYPQLMNSTNTHLHKEFFMKLQTDNEFREKVSERETYTNFETDLHHYNLYPLLHQRLLEVTRECVNGGYTKKISNSLHKIVSEVSKIGE